MRPPPPPPASCISSPLSRQQKQASSHPGFPPPPFPALPFPPSFSSQLLKELSTLMFPLPPSHLLQNQPLSVPKFNHDLHVSKLNGQLPILPDTVGLTFLPWLPGHQLLWLPHSSWSPYSPPAPKAGFSLCPGPMLLLFILSEPRPLPCPSHSPWVISSTTHLCLDQAQGQSVYPMNLRSSYPGHPTGVTHPQWPNGNPSHPPKPAPAFPISSHLEMPTAPPEPPPSDPQQPGLPPEGGRGWEHDFRKEKKG